jgi:hypothetical protein
MHFNVICSERDLGVVGIPFGSCFAIKYQQYLLVSDANGVVRQTYIVGGNTCLCNCARWFQWHTGQTVAVGRAVILTFYYITCLVFVFN